MTGSEDPPSKTEPDATMHRVWQRRRCPRCAEEEPQANTRKRGVAKTQFKCRKCRHCWWVVWVE